MKYLSIIFVGVFVILTLFHSSLLFPNIFQISGNYEFAKVLLFNAIFGVFLSFVLLRQRIRTNFFLLAFLGIVTVSTIFSLSPFTSLFGSHNKGHGVVVFFLLFLLSSLFFHFEKPERKQVINGMFFSLLPVSIIAIKEYYFPSFDYGELIGRALGTFGHPSYLGSYILILLPFLFQKVFQKKKILFLIFLIPSIIALFLTHHFLALCIFFAYTLYFFYSKKLKHIYTFALPIVFIVFSTILFLYFPEKLHSFLSRFSIWQSVLSIIFSSPKTLFLGNGLETLSSVFASYKVPSLYIFENFGFTADRAHNIFLDLWYHLGVGGLILSLATVFFLIKNFKRNPYYEACILFFLFNFFNFPSIITYILFLFFFTKILKEKGCYFECKKRELSWIFIPLLLLISFLSVRFYIAETMAYHRQYKEASEIFPYPDYFLYLGEKDPLKDFSEKESEKYIKSQIYTFTQTRVDCGELVEKFPSVENYFFCGEILENMHQEKQGIVFYKKGISKLPDLRNKDSPYWKNPIIKKTITGNRFFSEKYSHLKHILDVLGIKNDISK